MTNQTNNGSSRLVWLQNYYSISEAERLNACLQTCGICCRSSCCEDAQAALVLLGDSSPWQETIDFIRDCSRKGLRTLCLGLFHRPVEHHKIWELLAAGADEFLDWNQRERPEQAVLAKLERWTTVSNLLHSARVREQLVGESHEWQRLLRQVIEAAYFSTAPVLILGESGTGKELIAKLIHDLDRRPDKRDWVITDCATIVPELSGSEFFGHEKGAFTNAVSNRDGAFALADGGTLFLDEIGELPLSLQAELLRAIQEGTYKRVGSNYWRQSKFRLVSATNRNLQQETMEGRFREDLFFRISTSVCHMPPLRDRRGDIPALARFFLKKYLPTDTSPDFDEVVCHYLMTRDYRGNVRELQQLVARIAYRHTGKGPISAGDLPETDRPWLPKLLNPLDDTSLENALRLAVANGTGLKEIKRLVGNKLMDLVIADANGDLQAAAQRLQVSDRTLQLHAAGKTGSEE